MKRTTSESDLLAPLAKDTDSELARAFRKIKKPENGKYLINTRHVDYIIICQLVKFCMGIFESSDGRTGEAHRRGSRDMPLFRNSYISAVFKLSKTNIPLCPAPFPAKNFKTNNGV